MDNPTLEARQRGRRFSLPAQVFTAVGAVLVALVATGLVASGALTYVRGADEDVIASQGRLAAEMADLRDALWSARAAGLKIDSATRSQAPARIEELKATFDGFEQSLAVFTADYEETFGAALPSVDLVAQTWDGYKNAALVDGNARVTAAAAQSGPATGGFGVTLDSQLAEFSRYVDQRLADESASSAGSANEARALFIVITLIGLGLGIVVGLVVARRIRRNSAALMHAIQALAEGDLTVAAGVRSRDEMGEMSELLSRAQVS
ncbi:HAMP domain-containing protein, partial [Demequina iriomotensis]|uniref:HAMP domain-containing protein n=1 Tax=Demequina iriomotensis TaxID=1536641 RepID=UPI000A6D2A64